MNNSENTISIYTDGACRGNPGPGGWGVFITRGGRERRYKGGEPNTTSNRMELMACIQALKALKRHGLTVVIYTDSKYVQKGISEWIHNWKANGWRTSARAPVKNVDLWQELDALREVHSVAWQWVKGHAGIYGNEVADRLAAEGVTIAMASMGRAEAG